MRKGFSFILLLLGLAMLLPACTGHHETFGDSHGADHRISEMRERFDGASPGVLTVVIDPGHGGRDVGAIGASGRYEKDFTLSLARRVLELLDQEAHIQAFMTRTDDRFISQRSMYRTEYACTVDADLLISIHGNTYSDPNVSGTETFYYHLRSRRLAKIMQEYVAAATGFRDRGVTRKDLFVVRDAKMPAVLIEVGYLTNPGDESQMWTDAFQSRVAVAIVEGIKEYRRGLERWW